MLSVTLLMEDPLRTTLIQGLDRLLVRFGVACTIDPSVARRHEVLSARELGARRAGDKPSALAIESS